MTLDQLVVKLVLDASGFVKGQADAMDSLGKTRDSAVKSGKAIEGAALAANQGVEKLTRQFLTLFALVTGGRELKQFISELTATDAAVGRTAKNLDMSGRALSTWQGVAVAAGGSAEGITASMSGLSNAMQTAALTGDNKLAPVFRALGINLATTGGKARDVGAIMFDLNRRYNEMHIDPARFTAMMRMIGVDDNTTSLLEKSQAEFRKLYDEQQKYAASSEDLDAAQKRQDGWRSLILASTSFGRTILTAVTPAITGVMKAVQDWADANQAWIKTAIVEKVGEFVTWLKGLDWTAIGKGVQDFARDVGSLAAALASAAKEVDGNSTLFKAFEAFGALLIGSKVLGAINTVVAAVSGLGAMPVPALLRLFAMNPAVLGTAAVGAVLASGDPNKSVLAGGRPETAPQDNDLGLPGVGERGPNDTSRPDAVAGGVWDWLRANALPDFAKAGEQLRAFGKATGWNDRLGHDGPDAVPLPPERPGYSGPGEDGNALHRNDEAAAGAQRGGLWDALKRLVGFGDDPKVKDAIADTAKATGEIRDLMKAQRDGLGGGFAGVTASSGGLGGSGHHADGSSPGASLRDRQFHGKGNFGQKGWWTPERQSHAVDYLMKNAGLTEDGAKALVSRWTYVESPGGPTAINPKSGAAGIAQGLGSRRAGYTGSFDDQLANAARELNGSEGRARRMLNTPGQEAVGASQFERAEGYNPRTGEDNFTARTREGMKHIAHGSTAATAAPAAPAPTFAMSPEEVRNAEAWIHSLGIDHPLTQTEHDKLGPLQKRLDAYYASRPAPGPMTRSASRGPAPKSGPEISPEGRRQRDIDGASPTVAQAAHSLLRVMHQAGRIGSPGGDKPVAVEDKGVLKLQERTLGRWIDRTKRQPEELDRIRALMHGHPQALAYHREVLAGVMAHGGVTSHTTHNYDYSSDTRVGDITVNSRATDAKGVADDLRPYLFQGRDARQANRGLA